MTTVRRNFAASPDEIFSILSDPESYPAWLVGAQRIRHVDRSWPAPGSRFEHEVGVGGPLTVEDNTVSQGVGPGRHLELEARFRPIGRAAVTFDVSRDGDGATVTMEEHPVGALSVFGWALAPVVAARNAKSLANLDEFLGDRSFRAG